MDLLWDGLAEALGLVAARDPMVLAAAWRSLWISSLAVFLATVVGLPAGTLLARTAVPGKRLLILVSRASMAVPTVFVGLVCYAVFSRRGPLGPIELLYTPYVIIVGELFLALPIILSITHGAVSSLDPRVAETAFTLGAGPLRRWRTYVSEARVGITLAVLTAFARCVTELGIAMIVGGNIKDRTRTLATATALETGKGEFGRGIAMGLILLVLALGVTTVIALLNRDERTEARP